MAATYEVINTQTLSTATSAITFSSIPQTYTDLVVILTGSITESFCDCTLTFNNDTGSNYSDTLMVATAGGNGSGRHSNQTFSRGFYFESGQSNCIWNVMNYSNSTTYKTTIGRSNATASEIEFSANLWRSTSAITTITVTGQGATFTSGSMLTLYGIKAA
jgi:hypothetical protein